MTYYLREYERLLESLAELEQMRASLQINADPASAEVIQFIEDSAARKQVELLLHTSKCTELGISISEEQAKPLAARRS